MANLTQLVPLGGAFACYTYVTLWLNPRPKIWILGIAWAMWMYFLFLLGT
jgi:hypothetical protein